MAIDRRAMRRALQQFGFVELFVEILGWEHFNGQVQPVDIDGVRYSFTSVAHKRGLPIIICSPNPGGRIPDRSTRGKIDQSVRKQYLEHLIIFVDRNKTQQVWQWAKKEPGQPIRRREQNFQPGIQEEALIQRLEALHFPLDVEELLTISDVDAQMRSAFDRNAERVTTRFYERFQKEQKQFQGFISGITDGEHARWYASVMLNRLMFVYFIQKKGFLANDTDYLRNRLRMVRERRGPNEFQTFYRSFLLRLFHDALGKGKMPDGIAQLIGTVPYLNGGLFDVHQMEREYDQIDIPDEAFARIFDFFDAYQWHLDDRPLRQDNEINPDVLGHIFEKYVNQKQMGAYYTKEDITEYIGKNTIIPFLFDAARKDDRVAFVPDGAIWRRLADNPDQYIYEAVRKGTELALPAEVAVGIDDVGRRDAWNRPADEAYALPTEIWREHVTRRQRYEDLFSKVVDGEVTEINDLITYNLDIRQFAVDVIDDAESPDLVRAFWKAIKSVTVLDPTCGSGAFLFAALNILVPLYEACLDRMQEFVADAEAAGASQSRFSDFRTVLAEIEQHPNRRYFVLKRIILNNLYGVDIMEEAVEICKLRLFLKLASQLEDARHIEPLPDIDFNIRAGNTLVGFARLSEAQAAIGRKLDFDGIAAKVEEQAKQVAAKSRLFREQQDKLGGLITPEHKGALREQLVELEETLNQYLAAEYGIDRSNHPKNYCEKYEAWRESHQPFHWFVDFYDIMEEKGGFDVIIGNPPYVEYRTVEQEYRVLSYQTQACGNLYAFVLERSKTLASLAGGVGMIVPLSGHSTPRMAPLVEHFYARTKSLHLLNLSADANPSVLFPGVKFRLAIFTCSFSGIRSDLYTSQYTKWFAEERDELFNRPTYCRLTGIGPGSIPKLTSNLHSDVVEKIKNSKQKLGAHLGGNSAIYYHNTPVSWIRTHSSIPYFCSERDGVKTSTQLKRLAFESDHLARAFGAIIASTHFFIWWHTFSDCYHLTQFDLENFPIDLPIERLVNDLACLQERLEADMIEKSRRRVYVYRTSGRVEYDEFYPKLSKPIIDEIDAVLASHYGLNEAELDFVQNYQVKYRMGQEDLVADEQ